MTEKNKKIQKVLPEKMLPATPFHCEIDGGRGMMSAQLSGINSIRDFSDCAVLLRARGFFVKISGATLSLAVYENKTVEISGRLLCVEFLYDKA